MRILTKKQLIADVPKRWIEQYGENPSDSSKKKTYDELLKLGDDINKESIDKIIGNDSWTILTCDICEKDVDRVVVYDKYDSYGHFCKKCLSDALESIDNAHNT